MGLLTADAETAIANGNRVSHLWGIYVPRSQGSTSFNAKNIYPSGVIDAGSRDFSCYNLSVGDPGDFNIPEYTVVFDNSSGSFYPTGADSFFTNNVAAPDYEALAQECMLRHRVYIERDDGVQIELPCPYWGWIESVEYEDVGSVDSLKPALCTIKTAASVLRDALLIEWSPEEHANIADTGSTAYVDLEL